MNLDDRLAELVREALEPMLLERLDDLEARLTDTLASLARSKPEAATLRPLMTLKEVAGFLRVSTRTVRRLVDAGEFPAPLRAGAGRPRWSPDEIEGWARGRAGG